MDQKTHATEHAAALRRATCLPVLVPVVVAAAVDVEVVAAVPYVLKILASLPGWVVRQNDEKKQHRYFFQRGRKTRRTGEKPAGERWTSW